VSAAVATRVEPLLRVGADGVAAIGAGSFTWVVHRRAAPVAILATPLMALGAREELHVEVEVEAGTSITITGQGPVQLLETAQPVVQAWRFVLGPGAHVTFLPWLTIPYAGSRSSTTVEVELAPDASFVAWDVLAAGRVARVERFELAELRAAWRIVAGERLLLDERLLVCGDDRESALVMLAGRTHVGSLYAAGLPDRRLGLAGVRSAIAGLDIAGASRPDPDLLLVRALDGSADRLEQVLWPVVAAARAGAGVPPLEPWHVARRWF
jgi:urease accessory protein